jgi:hypothetical protein
MCPVARLWTADVAFPLVDIGPDPRSVSSSNRGRPNSASLVEEEHAAVLQ